MTDIDWELLFRYLGGDCTAAERDLVERWLAEAAEHRVLLEAVRRAGSHASQAADPFVRPEDQTAMWIGLQQEMRAASVEDVAEARPDRRVVAERRARSTFTVLQAPRWPSVVKIAAAVALVAGASVAAHRLVPLSNRVATVPAPTDSVMTTARGQRSVFHLPDGTLVMLAPGSTLRLASNYNTRDRAVRLDGEAAFTVTHDATRPFSVHTARAVARDLGTRFLVRAYAEDTAAAVVVAEGRVAVGRGGHGGSDSLVLVRGDLASITPSNLALSRDVPLDRYFAWTEGRLVFRGTSLRDAAVQLSRWYDIDVRLASPAIGTRPLTTSFRDEPASEALGVVAAALNLDIAQNGRHYTLRAR